MLDGEAAFNRGLQSVDREMRVLNSQLDALTSAYDKNDRSVEQLTAQNELLQKRADASKNKVKALESAVSESETAYQTALRAVSKFTDEQLRTEEAGILAAQALEKAEKTMDGYRIKLANAQKQLNKNTQELDANKKAIEEMDKSAKANKAEQVFKAISEQAQTLAKKMEPVIKKIQDIAGAAAKVTFKAAEKSVKAFADTTATAMAASVKAFTAYMGAAAGIGTALYGLSAKAALAADDINTLATQTGLTTAEIQKMQYASDLIDVDLETLTGSMAKLIKNMNTAAKGTGDAADAFAALGVSITNNDGTLRNNKEVFNEVISALSKIENETQRDAYAMSILGKSAQDLNPLILGGAEALEKLCASADTAGLILGEKALSKLNAFNDSLDILKANAKASGSVIALEFSDKFKVFTDIVGESIPKLAKAFTGLFDGSKNGAANFEKALGDIGGKLGKQIEKMAPSALSGVNNLILSIVSSINSALPGAIETLLPVLLTGFFGLVDGLVLELPTLAPNIADGSLAMFAGLMAGLESTSEKLLAHLPAIVTGITAVIETHGPVFLDSALGFFGNLLTGFADTVDLIVPKIPAFVETVSGKIISNIPTLIGTTVRVISTVSSTLITNLPLIVSAAVQIVNTLSDTLITPDNINLVITTALSLLETIVDTLIENLDEIIETAMTIISVLCTTLITSENIEKIVTTGLEILIKLIDGIVDNVDEILLAVEAINSTLIDELTDPSRLDKIVSLGIQLLAKLIEGLCKVGGKFAGFWWNMHEELRKTVFDINFAEIGGNVLDGIVDGLLKSTARLRDRLSGLGGSFVSAIKDIFEIHSPSRLMKREGIGMNLALGIVNDFVDTMDKDTERMAKSIPTKFKVAPELEIGDYDSPDTPIGRFFAAINKMAMGTMSNTSNSYNNKNITVYTNITIENAKLDSSQDIQETAEELAAEQNRILAGIGKEE